MGIFNSLKKRTPQDNLKQFLTVKNETLTSADLYFYGDIVSDWWGAWTDADQYPEAIRDFLKEQDGKALNIYINSGGGSVFAGLAIYNMLLRHKGFKTVYVDGMAASIASVIALAGDRVIIPKNAFIMIHKPWSWCDGNATDSAKWRTIWTLSKPELSTFTAIISPKAWILQIFNVWSTKKRG